VVGDVSGRALELEGARGGMHGLLQGFEDLGESCREALDVFNPFAAQDWAHQNDRPGYRHRRTVIARQLGAALPMLDQVIHEYSTGD
jgi:hypothetical protein